MRNHFKLDIDPDELREYYRKRLFELVDYDAIEDDRRKLVGSNRYEFINKLVTDIETNNSIYQSNGKTIGFMYGSFYTILLIFFIKIIIILF